MGLTVHIKHEAEVSELIGNYPCFSFIKSSKIPQDSYHTWNTSTDYWSYKDKTTYSVQVMFIGKTGYGKSTTLNRIVGKTVFETDEISVCTKDLYCAMYRINSSIPSFLEFCDLPGVGESNYADNHYYEWYKEMIECSDVVVYILRADQRDFAVDEMIFSNLLQGEDRRKLILALNYADKVEPLNRKPGLTNEQLRSLDRKINDVSRIFNIKKDSILYYSAIDGINFDMLINTIARKIKDRIG